MSIRLILGSSAAVVLALTACSSSKSNNTPAGAGSTPATTASSTTSAASTALTVALTNGVLVGPNGHTLYFNTKDTASNITCTGGCASAWPPLMGAAKAGSGIDQEDFATTTRPDGSTQVTYYGHPLYFFGGDAGAGDKKGNEVADGGGEWYATTPSKAEQLKPGGAGATSSSSSSSSGGYTY